MCFVVTIDQREYNWFNNGSGNAMARSETYILHLVTKSTPLLGEKPNGGGIGFTGSIDRS